MEGVAFIAALSLAAGLFGGGDSSIVYTWLDLQRTLYCFGYGSPWSPAELINALEGAGRGRKNREGKRKGGIAVGTNKEREGRGENKVNNSKQNKTEL